MKTRVSLLVALFALLGVFSTIAQELSMFERTKVVVDQIHERGDRKLSQENKQIIYDGIVEAFANSKNYAICSDVNIEDIKKELATQQLPGYRSAICDKIGDKSDYIVFTSVKLSTSELGDSDVKIFIESSMYRINTKTEFRSNIVYSVANKRSLVLAMYELVSGLLNEKVEVPEHIAKTPEELYYKGLGLYKESQYADAVKYLQYAADYGYVNAFYSLGKCYEDGRGVEKNVAKAVELYQRAAEKNHLAAQYTLGLCYESGNGVAKDANKAIALIRQAAEHGYAEAQYVLALRYDEGDAPLERNYQLTIEWLTKSAENGYEKAQLMLANCYKYGKAVAQDFNKYIEWMTLY